MKKYSVDHVSLPVKDLDTAVAFFSEVFGMEVFFSVGEAPQRQVWLDGGLQLAETTTPLPADRRNHIALNVTVEEREEICTKALSFGCTLAQGRQPFQWLQLPGGQYLELTDITRHHNSF